MSKPFRSAGAGRVFVKGLADTGCAVRAEGGNHAMQDALNLARAVAGAGAGAEGIAEALQGYQAEMLKRCKPAVEGSRKAGVDTAGTQPAEYVPWAKRDALKSGGVQA